MYKNSSAGMRVLRFDLLFLNGEDLRALPLIERKSRLNKLVRRKRSRILYVVTSRHAVTSFREVERANRKSQARDDQAKHDVHSGIRMDSSVNPFIEMRMEEVEQSVSQRFEQLPRDIRQRIAVKIHTGKS